MIDIETVAESDGLFFYCCMSTISDTIKRLRQELPSGVKLVAVSKFHPVEAIEEAYAAGQRTFGESRPQELYAKVKALPYPDIEWHFIGHLQTNKLKLVLPYVAMVESVDSLHLLEAIDRWGAENGRTIEVLLEYHIASEETKQGFGREEILAIVSGDRRKYSNVRIRGLMGMATFTDDEKVVRSDFSKLMTLYSEIVSLRDRGSCAEIGQDFNIRSFGMTHDYRIAVEMGADMVRIGTLIFGERVY